jgi:ribosome-associated protein
MSHASTQDTTPRLRACPTADASDAPLTPSKTQRKREAQALQTLGVQLVALAAARLVQLALPEALYEAVLAAQRMRSHGARTRQLQYIGKLMRQLELDALRRVRTALETGRAGSPQPQP